MRTAIAICFDSGYLDPASVLIESISDNYHSRTRLDVVCVMPEGSEPEFERLVSQVNLSGKLVLKLVLVSAERFSWLDDLAIGDKKFHASMWYRLFLGSILPDYDKVIYLDPDMMVVSDIQPIINYPMHNRLLAVYDSTIGVQYLYERSDINSSHFISGMFIADLVWWRESGIEDLFENDLKSNGPDNLLDEHLMNKYMMPYWHALPATFNFCFFDSDWHGVPDWDNSCIPMHYKHAIIMHFSGRIKPWNFKEIVTKDDVSALGSEWRRRLALIKTKRTVKNNLT